MVKRENVKVKCTRKTTHMVIHTKWVISVWRQLWPHLVQSSQLLKSGPSLVIYNRLSYHYSIAKTSDAGKALICGPGQPKQRLRLLFYLREVTNPSNSNLSLSLWGSSNNPRAVWSLASSSHWLLVYSPTLGGPWSPGQRQEATAGWTSAFPQGWFLAMRWSEAAWS